MYLASQASMMNTRGVGVSASNKPPPNNTLNEIIRSCQGDCNKLLYVFLTALRNYGDTVHDFWAGLMNLDSKNTFNYMAIFTDDAIVISKKNIVKLKDTWITCYGQAKIPNHEKDFIDRNLNALLANTTASILAEPFGNKSSSYEYKIAAFIEYMVMNYDTSPEGPRWVSFVRNPDHEQHIIEVKPDGTWRTKLSNAEPSDSFQGKKYISFSLGIKRKSGIFTSQKQLQLFQELRKWITEFFTPIKITNPEHQLLIDAVCIGLDKLLTKENTDSENKLIQIKGLSAQWDAAGKSGLSVDGISGNLLTTSYPPMNPVTQQCIYANTKIQIQCSQIDVEPLPPLGIDFKKSKSDATSINGIINRIKKIEKNDNPEKYSEMARLLEYKRFGDSATSDETYLLNNIFLGVQNQNMVPDEKCPKNDKKRFTIGATHDKSALSYWLLNKQPVMFTHFTGGHGEKELYITCLYPDKEDPSDEFFNRQNALMNDAIKEIADEYKKLEKTIKFCIDLTRPSVDLHIISDESTLTTTSSVSSNLFTAFRFVYSDIPKKAKLSSDKFIAYMHLRALYLFENCIRAEMIYKKTLYDKFQHIDNLTDGYEPKLKYNRLKGLLNRVYELQKWRGITESGSDGIDFQETFDNYTKYVTDKIQKIESGESVKFVLERDFDIILPEKSSIKKFIGYERDKWLLFFYKKLSQPAYRDSINSLQNVIQSRTSRGGGFQTRFTEDCNRMLNVFYSIEKGILERIDKINDMASIRVPNDPDGFLDFEDNIALCEEYREAIETLAEDVRLSKGWLFHTGQKGGVGGWFKRQRTENPENPENPDVFPPPTPPRDCEIDNKRHRKSYGKLQELCKRFSKTSIPSYDYKNEDQATRALEMYALLNEFDLVEDVFTDLYRDQAFSLNVEAFADFLFPIFITYTFEERELLTAIAKSFEARLAEAERPGSPSPQEGGRVPSSFTPHSLRWYYKTYYPSYYELYYKNQKDTENSDVNTEEFVKI